MFQEESFKWSQYGQILLQNNEFQLAEKCANFALYFQTSPSVRAQAYSCRAFAQYGLGRSIGARNDINEVKRLDGAVAKVRRNKYSIFTKNLLFLASSHGNYPSKCGSHTLFSS